MPEVGKLYQNLETGGFLVVSEVTEDPETPLHPLHLFYYRVAGLENGEFIRHTITPSLWKSSYYEVKCVA